MNVIAVNQASFKVDVLDQQLPVLLDIYTSWCGPCKSLAPLVEQLADDYKGKLRVCKLDGDANAAVVHGYGVRAYPTLLMFARGQIVTRVAGSPGTYSALAAFVQGGLDMVRTGRTSSS